MATVKIKNVTNFARTGVVTLGIPFAPEDDIRPGDILVVDEAIPGVTSQKIQWYAQGVRWYSGNPNDPYNGPIKYVRATFKTSLQANEEKTVQVRKATSFNTDSSLRYTLSPTMLSNILSTRFLFNFNGRVANFTIGEALQWTGRTMTPPTDEVNNPTGNQTPISTVYSDTGPQGPDGKSIDAFLGTPQSQTEEYGHMTRYVCFYRPFSNDSDYRYQHIWIQLVIEALSDQPYANFYFRFGYFRYEYGFKRAELVRVKEESEGDEIDEYRGLGRLSATTPFESDQIIDSVIPTTDVSLKIYTTGSAGLAASRMRAEQWKFNIQPTTDADGSRFYRFFNPAVNSEFGANETRLAAGASNCYKGVLCYDNSTTCQAELTNVGTLPPNPGAPTSGNLQVFPPPSGHVYLPSSEILSMCVDWKDLYPVTRLLPPRPSYVTSDTDYFLRSVYTLGVLTRSSVSTPANRGAYNHPNIGPNPNTADAGEHGMRNYAYGLRGIAFMAACCYYWIPLLEFNSRQESARFNWFMGDDGKPMDPDVLKDRNTLNWNGWFWPAGSGSTTRANMGRYLRPPSLNSTTYTRIRQLPTSSSTFNIPFPHGGFGTSRSNVGQNCGPDKEHWTNSVIILQGFISMDWFSLEYAKNHLAYQTNAQRPDCLGGPSQSAIPDWGATRGAGRISQALTLLHEFTGTSSFRTMMRNRVTVTLDATAGNTILPGNAQGLSRRLLKKSNFPSGANGIDRIMTFLVQAPDTRGSALDDKYHYRPWEDGEGILGFYYMAKGMLAENPNEPVAQICLQLARDVAGSSVDKAILDLRPGQSPNRLITLRFDVDGVTGGTVGVTTDGFYEQHRRRVEFMRGIDPGIVADGAELGNNTNPGLFRDAAYSEEVGWSPTVRALTVNPDGTSNGKASGRVRLMYVDGEFGWARPLALWLTDSEGQFDVNDIVRLSSVSEGGVKARVLRVDNIHGYKNKFIESPSRGYAYDLTQKEEDEIILSYNPTYPAGGYIGNAPNNSALRPRSIVYNGTLYQIANTEGWFHYGYFKYHRDYYVYALQISPALPVAKEAALLGYYQKNNPSDPNEPDPNAVILQKVESLREYLTPLYQVDNLGTSLSNSYAYNINESILCFVGYLTPTYFGGVVGGPTIVNVASQRCSTSTPSVTPVIANQQINTTREPSGSISTFSIGEPSVVIQNAQDYQASALPTIAQIQLYNSTRQAGTTVTLYSTTTSILEIPIISQLITTSSFPGKKVTVIVTMGLPYVTIPGGIGDGGDYGGGAPPDKQVYEKHEEPSYSVIYPAESFKKTDDAE